MWGLEPQSKGPTEPMCDPSLGLEHMLRTAQQFLVACAEYYKQGAHINLHGKRLREALGKQLTADSSGCEQGWQKPSHFCRPGKESPESVPITGPKFFKLDLTDDEAPADDEQMKPLWEVNPDGNPLVPPDSPPPQRHEEVQKVKPSLCSPEELGSEMTWQEVVSLLEDHESPFQAKEATLLSFIEAQEEEMAEDSLAWGWCRMVLQALEQGEDITGKAIQQAQEVIASELPKRKEPLPPQQALGQQDREDHLVHGGSTDSEAPSHEKVKPSASPDQYLSIMSANVTSFNNGALEWVTSSKAKVVCLQETHLTPEMLHGRRATLQSLGWDLYAEPASLSDKGTRLGGTACAFPKNSGVWAESHLPMQRGGLHSRRSEAKTVGLHDCVPLPERHRRPKWPHKCRGAILSGGVRADPPRALGHLGGLEPGPD